MIYNQPLATRFGSDLLSHLASGTWSRLDIAVAWIRSSGLIHIESALERFLLSGSKVRIIVGIDLDNTTKEGLEGLLDLAKYGDMEIYIHHNEAGSIFHPKLYLFTNKKNAKLIVGSNNITQAGLFQNVEAGLEVNLPVAEPTILSAIHALDTWADTSMNLARLLDTPFLSELVKGGYVQDEASVNKSRSTRSLSAGGKRKKRLFGSVHITAPTLAKSTKTKASKGGSVTKKTSKKSTLGSGVVGQTLLMRIRKAHATKRPTQTQIPKSVATRPFFSGVPSITSRHTGESRKIHEAKARGIVNTLKLEIPEMREFADPVVRFERTPTGISYEVYDSSSAGGTTIMNSLRAGRAMTPSETFLTLPKDPSSSTWWRFI